MSKTVLVVCSIASAMLLACMAAVLTATPGASQTQTLTLVGAGDIAECSPHNNAKATAALLAKIPGTVLALGDNVYPDGTPRQYANCYDNYRLFEVVSSMPNAPPGGVSTKLARCRSWVTMSTTLPK
jgi:hypothetical protein